MASFQSMAKAHPRVVLQAPQGSQVAWLEFLDPVEVLQTSELSQVESVLERVDRAASTGLLAAGFVSYEAAPAFDTALVATRGCGPPLVWFGLFECSRALGCLPDAEPGQAPHLDWKPSLSKGDYLSRVEAIHRHIAAGDTYQVNLTFPLEADLDRNETWNLFRQLYRQQRSNHCAYIDTGEWVLCSSSPELFFCLDGDRIVCRPMKGTIGRGRNLDEDEHNARWLQQSRKNRAENVMIVDMVRNDLGRIARPGTVEVKSLWDLEKYPSLFQLTSTIEAESDARLPEIFAGLFPCASIIGAPKVRASEIIAELETEPRGIYTGAIGLVGPGRQASFNVAIRTIQVDCRQGRARYGTGGGIVWESAAEDEWDECRTKGLILKPPRPHFELLETLLWSPSQGYYLLERHLQRLQESAAYFDYRLDLKRVRSELSHAIETDWRSDMRVRLLVNAVGDISLEASVLESATKPWRVTVASDPVDSTDPFLFHKTTNRRIYDERRISHSRFEDVILWNERREITESTLANIVLRLHGRLVTPPIDSGLLAGTMRAELLEQGRVEEQTLCIDDLLRARELILVNSVRGWIPARLTTDDQASPKSSILLTESISADSE
jgi:para-aminobenzoate synthetase/4-amino-4-deoxychorismate lyase